MWYFCQQCWCSSTQDCWFACAGGLTQMDGQQLPMGWWIHSAKHPALKPVQLLAREATSFVTLATKSQLEAQEFIDHALL
jgi:hypothetical protein